MTGTLAAMAAPTFNPAALTRLRYEAGLSQEALAVVSDVNVKTINRLELGAHQPRPSTLYKLAQALNANVADLLAVDES